MIFPILRGFLSPLRAPVTYLLFALNLLVFVGTFETCDVMDAKLDELLQDNSFIDTQGSAFAVMITRENHKHAGSFAPMLAELARKTLAGDREDRKILGNLALRNNDFMDRAPTYEFGGDEVALARWRERFQELNEIQAQHPSYIWGLSRTHRDFVQFVTYQFSHSGFLHLFWNMVFLVLFGAFIEAELGSSFVILTYLGSGIVGALVFSKIAGISSSPLVGASAAVSGLISLVGVGWLRGAGLRFFYWVLPFRGYFGFARLPSWLVLVTLLLPDLSGTIGASPEISSVAYAAHIGGALFGAAIAMCLAFGWMVIEASEMEQDLA